MSKKFVVHDTADVTITHKASGKVILNAEMQLASISGTISEEDLRGGIGNRKLYKIRTDKDINLNIRSAFGDMEIWAMTQGVEVDAAGTSFVTKNERVQLVEAVGATGDLEAKIKDITATGVKISGADGTQATYSAAAGLVTITAAEATAAGFVAGQEVIVYFQAEIIGRKIQIYADKFSEKYSVQYRTIAYDPDTHEQYSDIFFTFPDCIPAGDFEISLENGSVYTPEISFSVMSALNSTLYGEITENVIV